MPEQRLDAALAARGLARSRTHAATLIAAGVVSVDGRAVVKPALKVAESAVLEVAASDHYVSRAAHKLIAALDGFGVDPAGRVVLDAGASTGGFSQVLLERGARTVLAVDVGHGQLAPELRDAPGLVLVEGCNVRHLDRAILAAQTGGRRAAVARDGRPLVHLADDRASGAARDRDRRRRLRAAREAAVRGRPRGSARGGRARRGAPVGGGRERALERPSTLGLGTAGVLSSPIAGSHGNHEYLVHLSAPHGVNPTEWMRRVERLTGGANA